MSGNIFNGRRQNNYSKESNDSNNTDWQKVRSKKMNSFSSNSSSNKYVPPGRFSQAKKNDNYSSNRFTKNTHYRIYNNKKNNPKPEFKIENNDFPSLGGNKKSVVQNDTTQKSPYSAAINYKNAAEKGSKIISAPTPKKFVSLVTKSKKKRVEVEEYESDGEREEDYETAWFPYTSEDEEYYDMTEQEYKMRENDFDY